MLQAPNLEEAKPVVNDTLNMKPSSRRLSLFLPSIDRIISIDRPLASSDLDTITAAKKEDGYNRQKLQSLYWRARKYISDLPSPFRNDLDLYFPGCENRLRTCVEDLQSSQCVLLVAGEMGSGKSSLVNLLLGVDLMPTSELQCTSTIVEISYGHSPQVTAHYLDDSFGRSRTPISLRLQDVPSVGIFLEQVELLVCMRDETRDESPFEKVQLQWPIEMLQGGVTIVDSPGVGGNKGLPQVLSSYLERAFGFIYVTDSKASIHHHKLGQLLLKAIDTNGGFDHSTTIFVCNHMDKVLPEDTEMVIGRMRSKLGMIVPGARKIQLYPISVKESAEGVKCGQITPQHHQLMDGIRKFLPQTMRGKLRLYYRYLSNVLKRVRLSLQISFNINKDKVDDIRKCLKDVGKRISVLQKNPKERLDKIRLEMKKSIDDASFGVLAYLSSMYKRTRLARWQDYDCPKREDSWQNILRNANAAIADRVAEDINAWEQEEQFVHREKTKIVQLFKEQFKLFDDQLQELEGAQLHGNNVRQLLIETNGNDKNSRQMKQQKLDKNTKDSFLSIGAAVTSSFNLDPKDPKVRELFRNKYNLNATKAMEEATHMYLNSLHEGAVADAMGKYFNRLLKGIDRVGSMVPELVKANQNLLGRLNEELQKGSLKLSKLPAMAQSCSKIEGDLDMFYVQRLIVSDFTPDQIIKGDCLGTGSFAKVFKGTLRQARNDDEQVALKEPIHKLRQEEVTDVLLEEFMLRDLKHQNIIKYYGMYKTGTGDNVKLIFVMEYCPFTLKEKCVVVENSPSRLGNDPDLQRDVLITMTRYLLQICHGLTYLHHKFIVHRDLKPENVLLNVQDEVKIADFGLAQKLKDIVGGVIGTPIYIAPEVLLLNDKYDTKVDIYSFAMIMWEVWYGRDLSIYALSEIQDGLKNAIEARWRPALSIVQPPPTCLVELITTCWDQDPKKRPTMAEIGKKLKLYRQELLILQLPLSAVAQEI